MKASRPILKIVVLLALLAGSPSYGNERTVRVMLVHGVWASSIWEKAIRQELEGALSEVAGYSFEISEQFLGFYSLNDAAPVQRFSTHIEALIREQSIEFVVCVMPAACDFILDVDVGDAHLVTIGARDRTNEELRMRPNATGIVSPAAEAIRATLSQIRALSGHDRRIHFLSGSGINDRRYARLAEQLIAEHFPQQAYQVHVAMAVDGLAKSAASLTPGRDVAFVLATEAFGDPPVSFPDGSLARTLRAAPVPAFVFWDAALGTGVVGGSMASAAGYATRARDVIAGVLRGETVPGLVTGHAVTIYDAAVAEKWGLDLSRLAGPVRLVNRTPTLWETNPALVIVSLATVLLLVLVIALLTVLLHLNRRSSRELAQRERQARESEAKYRLVAESSADVIWTYEVPERRFSYCSPAISALTGYTVDEFLTRPVNEVLTPDSFDRLRSEVQTGGDAVVLEMDYRHKHESTVPTEVSFQVFRNERGAVERLVGISRDIRERRLRQQEAEDRAEQRMQRQKMEALGTLAAGIAHDFNNVLGVITGLVDLQSSELKSNEQARELNERMREAAERAQRLVRRILTFSRRSAEGRSQVELSDILKASARHVGGALPDGVRVRSDVPDDLSYVTVRGDRNQIEQAVINLLTNAIEAVGDSGSILLSLRVLRLEATTRMTVGSLEPGDYACICVEDDGPGINASNLSRIFEPFFTSKQLGSGIGLAIVHGVVMEHGGAIQLSSSPEEGTRFEIYLPSVVRAQPVQPAEHITDAADVAAAPSSRLRVLLVDDQEQLLDVVAKMVRKLGHSCIACSDPTRVEEILHAHGDNLDVLITDYSMPGMSGGDVIELASRDYPHLITFLSTGYATAEAEALARGKGAFGVLPKPLTMRHLADALSEAVGWRRERGAG